MLFLIYLTAIILSGNRMPLVLFLLSIFLIILFEQKTRKYLPITLIIISSVFFIIYKNNSIVKDSFDSFFDNSKDIINVFVIENITKSSKIPEKEYQYIIKSLKLFMVPG